MDEQPKALPPPDAAPPDKHAPAAETVAPEAAAAPEPVNTVVASELPAEVMPETAAPAPAATELVAPTAPAPVVDEGALAFRRVTRQATALAIGLCVMAAAGTALSQREGPPDLAAKKPWRASSKYADCHPERFDCGGAKTGIFFHTNLDAEPWVEIDLLAPTTFSSASVGNRLDCCQERAVPLILEASDDRTTWRELARHDTVFAKWNPTFAPVTARFLRLRVPRESFLHLDTFKVHP